MENTLLIGNGFSRTLVKGIPSWDQLLDKLKNEKATDKTVSEKKPEDKAPEDFDGSLLSNTLRYEKAVIILAKAAAESKKKDQAGKNAKALEAAVSNQSLEPIAPLAVDASQHNGNPCEEKSGAGQVKESADKDIFDQEIKDKLAEALKIEHHSLEKDYEDYLSLFGELLYRHNITNVLTTNYEGLIESILVDKCGYTDVTPANKSIMTCQWAKDDEAKSEKMEYRYTEEDLYNIRTRKVYTREYAGGKVHIVKLWTIHGDALRESKKYNAEGTSMILGFDQYCGQLAKLWAYLKGSYQSDDDKNAGLTDADIGAAKCDTPMKDKIERNQFDGISWAELFFSSNVYIAGFGMDYAEIDLWWLINQRARMKYVKNVKNMNNKICFLYHPIYDNPEQQPEMKARIKMLECFDVECKPINVYCKARLKGYQARTDACAPEDKIVGFEKAEPLGYLEGIFALIPEREYKQ